MLLKYFYCKYIDRILILLKKKKNKLKFTIVERLEYTYIMN